MIIDFLSLKRESPHRFCVSRENGVLTQFGAYVRGVDMIYTGKILNDGVPNFDSVDGSGLDSGPRNDVVRTHDEFQYLVQLATDDAEKDLRIQLVMPQHAGKQVAVWSYLPTACKRGSTLSTDKRTIDCRLGDVASAGTLAVYFQGVVLGSSGNGDKITPPSLEVSANGQVQPGPASLPNTLTVSAAPFYDVVVQQSVGGP